MNRAPTQRIGMGFDIHRFSEDPQSVLILGGIRIDASTGLVGHSDADVVSHAISDALLGAAGLGDMGEHFADTDPRWAGADSIAMLCTTVEHCAAVGWQATNVDCTVLLERPKLMEYRGVMQERLSVSVGAPVNVKASRAEGLGAIGRIEGAACWAVVLMEKIEAGKETGQNP